MRSDSDVRSGEVPAQPKGDLGALEVRDVCRPLKFFLFNLVIHTRDLLTVSVAPLGILEVLILFILLINYSHDALRRARVSGPD